MDIKVGDRFMADGREWVVTGANGEGDWVLTTPSSASACFIQYRTSESIAASVAGGSWAVAVCPTCDTNASCPECRADVVAVERARAEPGEPVPWEPMDMDKMYQTARELLQAALRCEPGCAPATPCMRASCPAWEEGLIDGKMFYHEEKRAVRLWFRAGLAVEQRDLREPSFSGLGALACSIMGPR
jgi:hypothetical protein